MPRVRAKGLLLVVTLLAGAASIAAQQAPAVPPAAAAPLPLVAVRPITPPKHALPAEDATARVTRFSFIAYGDTRSGSIGDGQVVHPVHSQIADAMVATIKERDRGRLPVRFVLHTGDAVLSGADGRMWNASFVPIVDGLIKRADIPYFFSIGNHDATSVPVVEGGRERGIHNTMAAVSALIPAEGSPRRLNGYLTYAFGYGNVFFIAVDSNIASDPMQLAWVSGQLAGLDRTRFPHIIVFTHYPVVSSGPHGGATLEPQSLALRNLYMPLFRRHHVRMLLVGHEHFFEHWVERYEDGGREYRLDQVVTGGGGAPLYTYRGEPDLSAYLAAGAAQRLRLEHLVKPGATIAANPNHFVVVNVDGDRLSIELIAPNDPTYGPFAGRATVGLGSVDAATSDTP